MQKNNDLVEKGRVKLLHACAQIDYYIGVSINKNRTGNSSNCDCVWSVGGVNQKTCYCLASNRPFNQYTSSTFSPRGAGTFVTRSNSQSSLFRMKKKKEEKRKERERNWSQNYVESLNLKSIFRGKRRKFLYILDFIPSLYILGS